MTIAIFPGSFDPLTNGHYDIAVRASKLFDKLVLAIYHAPIEKVVLFNTEERVALAKQALAAYVNIEVMPYTGLTGELARRVNARVMVRGLRMGGDFEREFNLAMMSKNFFPELRTMIGYLIVITLDLKGHSFIGYLQIEWDDLFWDIGD